MSYHADKCQEIQYEITIAQDYADYLFSMGDDEAAKDQLVYLDELNAQWNEHNRLSWELGE